ncbi:type II toxin-antitoxin system RelE/ParE family toxin [Neorhizobium sp. LjRoot104]|uniref:type II toxin-antitoxin system RelE/ParE family toxin n=1 Tax=Neorhizobium sp. LjRoot104 TaxID=3342254 RepID=UPI003ECD007A
MRKSANGWASPKAGSDEVTLSREAIEDLVRIGDHIFPSNPARADTFVTELESKCLQLAEMPLAFSKVPHGSSAHIRRRPHGSYLIFYEVLDTEVVVLRVLHGAQDYKSILFPDD